MGLSFILLKLLSQFSPIYYRFELTLSKLVSENESTSILTEVKKFLIRICPMKFGVNYEEKEIIRKIKRKYSISVAQAQKILQKFKSERFLEQVDETRFHINILYSKARKQIYNLISKYPGLHVNHIVKSLDIPKSTLLWHLVILEENQLIKIKKIGKFKLMADSSANYEDIVLGFMLLKPEIKNLLNKLTTFTKGMTKSDIVDYLKASKSTVSYLLVKLVNFNLVDKIEGSPQYYKLKPDTTQKLPYFVKKQQAISTEIEI